jgi:hypothetical protein
MNPDAALASIPRPVLLPAAPWCEFCNEKLSIGPSADGTEACADCAAELVAAHAKYEAEMAEVAGLHFGPSRAQRRAFRRKQLLRNDGSPKE